MGAEESATTGTDKSAGPTAQAGEGKGLLPDQASVQKDQRSGFADPRRQRADDVRAQQHRLVVQVDAGMTGMVSIEIAVGDHVQEAEATFFEQRDKMSLPSPIAEEAAIADAWGLGGKTRDQLVLVVSLGQGNER